MPMGRLRPWCTGIAGAGALAIAGCSAPGNDPGPGGVTVDEAKALDEAAEMLDAQQSDLAVPPADTQTRPGEAPPKRADAPPAP